MANPFLSQEVTRVDIGIQHGQTAVTGDTVRRRNLPAGISAVLCGAGLIGYMVAFGAWLASTGVNIDGDPASQPAKLAQQLVNGASSPMWVLYLVLAVVALATAAAAASLAGRLRSPVAGGLGTAALVVLAVAFVMTSAVTQKAGSAVLPKDTLAASVPVLFGVVIPSLLGAFCLLASAWTLTVSWTGWRRGGMPALLCIVGALTGVVLLTGITGAPGVEVAIAPWLICAACGCSDRRSTPRARAREARASEVARQRGLAGEGRGRASPPA
jgi:hypothetical protein